MLGFIRRPSLHLIFVYSLLILVLSVLRLEIIVLCAQGLGLEQSPSWLMLASHQSALVGQKYQAFAQAAEKQAQRQYQINIAASSGPSKAQSQYLLGVTYRCGLKPNRALAANWFEQALDNGHPLALSALQDLQADKPCKAPTAF